MRTSEQNPLRQQVEAYVREAVTRMPEIPTEDILTIVDIVWRGLTKVTSSEKWGGPTEIFRLHLPRGRKRIDLTLKESGWASSDARTEDYAFGGVDFETRWLYLAAFVILQMRADERQKPVLFEDTTGHTGLGEIITRTLSVFSQDPQPPRIVRGKSLKGEEWYTYNFKGRILPRT